MESKMEPDRNYNAGTVEKNRLYTLSEVATFDACPVSVATLKKYCQQGKIGHKIGRQWVLNQKDILYVYSLTPDDMKAGRPRKEL